MYVCVCVVNFDTSFANQFLYKKNLYLYKKRNDFIILKRPAVFSSINLDVPKLTSRLVNKLKAHTHTYTHTHLHKKS